MTPGLAFASALAGQPAPPLIHFEARSLRGWRPLASDVAQPQRIPSASGARGWWAVASAAGAALAAAAPRARRRAVRRKASTASAAVASGTATAQRDRCYVGELGPPEEAKLAALRGRLAEIVKAAGSAGPLVWGVDIAKDGPEADAVLLKYLRAEDLGVDQAASRLSRTLTWRKELGVDALAAAELPPDCRGHDTIGGLDRAGRPVLVSRYGGMDNEKVFGDIDGFVLYRIQVTERALALLRLGEPGAPEDLCQVHDYSGVPLLFKTAEVKKAVNAIAEVFTEHYPETKGKTIFVNFPTIFSRLFQAFTAFVPERTRQKFLILGEADHAVLFDQLGPEVLPVALGGLVSERPSPLEGVAAQVAALPAGSSREMRAEALGPGSLNWEVRACFGEAAYELFWVPAGGGQERPVSKGSLKASEGVVAGEYIAKEAGTLVCRCRNEAWLQQRVCVFRAGATTKA